MGTCYLNKKINGKNTHFLKKCLANTFKADIILIYDGMMNKFKEC